MSLPTTEDQYYKQLTSMLTTFIVYLNETKNTDLKYQDLIQFQDWIIQKNNQNNGKEQPI